MESMEEEFEPEDISGFNETIASLPEKYGSVLSLLLKGYSLKEISQSLDINIGTVKSHISRAKDILKKRGKNYD